MNSVKPFTFSLFYSPSKIYITQAYFFFLECGVYEFFLTLYITHLNFSDIFHKVSINKRVKILGLACTHKITLSL